MTAVSAFYPIDAMRKLLDDIHLEWNGNLKFTAERAGFQTSIDGNEETAPSPVGLLMESVAACAAIDVVLILKKGKEELESLTVETRALRAEDPPQFIKRLQLTFHLSGDVDEAKARRAIQLSFEKYCSVYHSLRKDIALEWGLTLNGTKSAG